MRIIGHLPSEILATRFGDALRVEGISNQVEHDAGGWAVWVHGEDQIERARGLLGEFQQNPDDARFVKAARQARRIVEQAEKADAEAARRVVDRRQLFRKVGGFSLGWVTGALIALSLVVTAWIELRAGGEIQGLLSISNTPGFLREVRAGQVWRLITPIFMHFGMLHLFFNMMCLFDLGGMIEGRLGSRRLGLLVLVIGVVSNLGQYIFIGPHFGGMSGVVYGLLGFAWIRGKIDPASGLFLHPQTVVVMLAWFVFCFTPWMPNVANGAHAVGLAAGLAWGWLSGMAARR